MVRLYGRDSCRLDLRVDRAKLVAESHRWQIDDVDDVGLIWMGRGILWAQY
jgi:hypothetical protein